ncbi:MAG: hypothetical protein IT355_07490 [Gemmatimonadaceae bacterium]|nr:hypothetical protein [Gemmatimonadaceae bacterium]
MECPLPGDAGDDRGRRRSLARGLRRWCGALALGACALLAAGPLPAAPPGALRRDAGRFTILHYAPDAALADALLRSAMARDTFPGLPRSGARVLVMLAPDAATFTEWAGRSAFPWTAALAFVGQQRIVMQGRGAPSSAGDPLVVLRHELAHLALYDHLGGASTRWFDEGYASYAAGEERTTGFLATNAALVFRGVPTLAGLDSLLSNPRSGEARAGYALALRAVSDLAAIDRERGLGPLLAAWKERGSFDLALRRAAAVTAGDFERDWQQRTRWSFGFLALVADGAIGTLLLLALLVPLHRRRRNAQRARLDAMRAREALLERAAQSSALDALLGSLPPVPPRLPPDA